MSLNKSEHQNMQNWFIEQCESRDIEYEYDVYMNDQTKVIDILVSMPWGKIAVEFLCSPMSVYNFINKIHFYKKLDFFSLWILGGNYYDNTKRKTLHKRQDSEYYIQRVKGIESQICYLQEHLYYLCKEKTLKDLTINQLLLQGTFTYRWNAKTLGWYNLQVTTFDSMLNHFKESMLGEIELEFEPELILEFQEVL